MTFYVVVLLFALYLIHAWRSASRIPGSYAYNRKHHGNRCPVHFSVKPGGPVRGMRLLRDFGNRPDYQEVLLRNRHKAERGGVVFRYPPPRGTVEDTFNDMRRALAELEAGEVEDG